MGWSPRWKWIQGGGVQLVAVLVDYSEKIRVLTHELRHRLL
jgi:hypothetical protein